jgi:hypothetical protein
MGKVWVLDTETKGTGAQMVPLEKVAGEPAPTSGPILVGPRPAPRLSRASEPRQPRRFKVDDVMTRQVLAEGADARATVELLKTIRSIVDVSIYVWEPKREEWRMLTHREKKLIWGFRDQVLGS